MSRGKNSVNSKGGTAGGGSGTVTSVSVVTANGFSGTVTNATTTPAITLAVNNASTLNNSLGNSHGTYTPTFTPIEGTVGSCTPLYDSLYMQVDTEAISGSMTVQINLDGGESSGIWDFDLPILPNNNFTDQFQLQVNVGYPINQAINVNWVIKASAEIGTKQGRLTFNSDTAGDTIFLSLWYNYHNQP